MIVQERFFFFIDSSFTFVWPLFYKSSIEKNDIFSLFFYCPLFAVIPDKNVVQGKDGRKKNSTESESLQFPRPDSMPNKGLGP